MDRYQLASGALPSTSSPRSTSVDKPKSIYRAINRQKGTMIMRVETLRHLEFLKSHPQLREWMDYKEKSYKAFCKYCEVDIPCSFNRLLIHAGSKKHLDVYNTLKMRSILQTTEEKKMKARRENSTISYKERLNSTQDVFLSKCFEILLLATHREYRSAIAMKTHTDVAVVEKVLRSKAQIRSQFRNQLSNIEAIYEILNEFVGRLLICKANISDEELMQNARRLSRVLCVTGMHIDENWPVIFRKYFQPRSQQDVKCMLGETTYDNYFSVQDILNHLENIPQCKMNAEIIERFKMHLSKYSNTGDLILTCSALNLDENKSSERTAPKDETDSSSISVEPQEFQIKEEIEVGQTMLSVSDVEMMLEPQLNEIEELMANSDSNELIEIYAEVEDDEDEDEDVKAGDNEADVVYYDNCCDDEEYQNYYKDNDENSRDEPKHTEANVRIIENEVSSEPTLASVKEEPIEEPLSVMQNPLQIPIIALEQQDIKQEPDVRNSEATPMNSLSIDSTYPEIKTEPIDHIDGDHIMLEVLQRPSQFPEEKPSVELGAGEIKQEPDDCSAITIDYNSLTSIKELPTVDSHIRSRQAEPKETIINYLQNQNYSCTDQNDSFEIFTVNEEGEEDGSDEDEVNVVSTNKEYGNRVDIKNERDPNDASNQFYRESSVPDVKIEFSEPYRNQENLIAPTTERSLLKQKLIEFLQNKIMKKIVNNQIEINKKSDSANLSYSECEELERGKLTNLNAKVDKKTQQQQHSIDLGAVEIKQEPDDFNAIAIDYNTLTIKEELEELPTVPSTMQSTHAEPLEPIINSLQNQIVACGDQNDSFETFTVIVETEEDDSDEADHGNRVNIESDTEPNDASNQIYRGTAAPDVNIEFSEPYRNQENINEPTIKRPLIKPKSFASIRQNERMFGYHLREQQVTQIGRILNEKSNEELNCDILWLDPIVCSYMALLSNKPTVFNESALIRSFQEVLGEKNTIQTVDLMLYRHIVLLAYSTKYRLIQLREIMRNILNESDIRSILSKAVHYLMNWRRFFQEHIISILYRKTVYELLLEYKRRYFFLTGGKKRTSLETLQEPTVEDIRKFLHFDFNLKSFNANIKKRAINMPRKGCLNYKVEDLSLERIYEDIKTRLPQLVVESLSIAREREAMNLDYDSSENCNKTLIGSKRKSSSISKINVNMNEMALTVEVPVEKKQKLESNVNRAVKDCEKDEFSNGVELLSKTFPTLSSGVNDAVEEFEIANIRQFETRKSVSDPSTLISVIHFDPIITAYLFNFMLMPSHELPIYNRIALEKAFNEVFRETNIKEAYVCQLEDLRLYEKLLLLYYSNHAFYKAKLTNILPCFDETTIQKEIANAANIIREWQTFFKKYLAQILYKKSIFEMLCEFTRRYLRKEKTISDEITKQTVEEIQRFLRCHITLPEDWLKNFQEILFPCFLKRLSSQQASVSSCSSSLNLSSIYEFVKHRFNYFVKVYVKDTLIDDLETKSSSYELEKSIELPTTTSQSNDIVDGALKVNVEVEEKLMESLDEIIKEQLGKDPIIIKYFQLANKEKPTGPWLPIFREDLLHSALNQLLNKNHITFLNANDYDMYRQLILFKYSEQCSTVVELSAVMKCFSVSEIRQYFKEYESIIRRWRTFSRKFLVVPVFQQTLYEMLCEHAMRLFTITPSAKTYRLDRKAEEVLEFFGQNFDIPNHWLSDFCNNFLNTIPKMNRENYTFTVYDLRLDEVYLSIKQRLHWLVVEKREAIVRKRTQCEKALRTPRKEALTIGATVQQCIAKSAQNAVSPKTVKIQNSQEKFANIKPTLKSVEKTSESVVKGLSEQHNNSTSTMVKAVSNCVGIKHDEANTTCNDDIISINDSLKDTSPVITHQHALKTYLQRKGKNKQLQHYRQSEPSELWILWKNTLQKHVLEINQPERNREESKGQRSDDEGGKKEDRNSQKSAQPERDREESKWQKSNDEGGKKEDRNSQKSAQPERDREESKWQKNNDGGKKEERNSQKSAQPEGNREESKWQKSNDEGEIIHKESIQKQINYKEKHEQEASDRQDNNQESNIEESNIVERVPEEISPEDRIADDKNPDEKDAEESNRPKTNRKARKFRVKIREKNKRKQGNRQETKHALERKKKYNRRCSEKRNSNPVEATTSQQSADVSSSSNKESTHVKFGHCASCDYTRRHSALFRPVLCPKIFKF